MSWHHFEETAQNFVPSDLPLNIDISGSSIVSRVTIAAHPGLSSLS